MDKHGQPMLVQDGEILHVEKFDVKNKPKITFYGMLE
jgi:ribosomal protein L21